MRNFNTFDKRGGAGVTDPVLRMTTGADNSPTWTNYTPGVSERTSGTSKFMHAGIKNTDAQTDSSPAISATREYDAFGNVTASTGTHTGRFGYGGPYGYQEDEGGLKQLGHRLYDPVCGRFVTKDPIKDGRNWYVYCDGNPLVLTDPLGLFIVYIQIGPGGIGEAVVVAEKGDKKMGPDKTLVDCEPGEVVARFPVSNKPGSHAPFPDGTYPISGAYEGYHNGSGGYLGTTFKLQGGSAERRGTWLHGGKGEDYTKPTAGCIRAKESDLQMLLELYEINKDNGNNHRLVVSHDDKLRPGSWDLRPPVMAPGGKFGRL